MVMQPLAGLPGSTSEPEESVYSLHRREGTKVDTSVLISPAWWCGGRVYAFTGEAGEGHEVFTSYCSYSRPCYQYTRSFHWCKHSTAKIHV